MNPQMVVTNGGLEGTVEIEAFCEMCTRKFKITAGRAGFIAWRKGELIQKALPELPKEDRELLVSGTCSSCFDKLFAGEEEA
jgi:hypothetical protein